MIWLSIHNINGIPSSWYPTFLPNFTIVLNLFNYFTWGYNCHVHKGNSIQMGYHSVFFPMLMKEVPFSAVFSILSIFHFGAPSFGLLICVSFFPSAISFFKFSMCFSGGRKCSYKGEKNTGELKKEADRQRRAVINHLVQGA